MNAGLALGKEEAPRNVTKINLPPPSGLHPLTNRPSVVSSVIQDGWQSGRSRTLGKRVYLYR